MLMHPRAPLLFLYVLIFPNGKRYAGTSYSWKKRWTKSSTCGKTPVQKAIKHFGIGNVTTVPVAYGERTYILVMEVKAIADWKLTDRRFGYNVTLGGEQSPMHSPLVVAKRTKTIKDRPATEAQRKACKIRSNTPEAKARMAKLGSEVMSRPEVRAKGALSRTGVPSPQRGRKWTPEYREFILEARRRGKKSGCPKGHVWSLEAIASQAAGRVGGKRSKKTKQKMSKSGIARWANMSPIERTQAVASLSAGQQRRRERERAEKAIALEQEGS